MSSSARISPDGGLTPLVPLADLNSRRALIRSMVHNAEDYSEGSKDVNTALAILRDLADQESGDSAERAAVILVTDIIHLKEAFVHLAMGNEVKAAAFIKKIQPESLGDIYNILGSLMGKVIAHQGIAEMSAYAEKQLGVDVSDIQTAVLSGDNSNNSDPKLEVQGS